jgi:hypothetical protein
MPYTNEISKSQEGLKLKCSIYAEIPLLNASHRMFINALKNGWFFL